MMHKIYALFDFELNQKKGLSIESFIKQVNKVDAYYLQYRDKVNPIEIKIKNLKKIRELWSGLLIVNDDLSLVKYCDGLHLGQEDILKISSKKEEAVREIRLKIKDKILGLSTHNKEEVLEANSLDLDYIGLGAYRDTTTKDVSSVLGERLSYIASFSKHKVAAIGGVKKSDIIKNINFLVLGSDIYED
jgi:thiamine-phosphate pyrophosphorylase